jgi:hypothetical protein
MHVPILMHFAFGKDVSTCPTPLSMLRLLSGAEKGCDLTRITASFKVL